MWQDGVNITIQANGAALEEYRDGDGNIYVESTAGARFGVRFDIEPQDIPASNDDTLDARIYLDGKCVTGVLFDVRNQRNPAWPYVLDGAVRAADRKGIKEFFAFSSLQTTDGPPGGHKPADFKGLGEIKVTCTLGRKAGDLITLRAQEEFKPAVEQSLPEKCLKGRAISTQCSLADAQVLKRAPKFQPMEYPNGARPFTTFVFKYRSRTGLQQEGIIERSPSPVPLEDRDPDDLTPEEARELVRRLRARQQDAAKIKQENAVKAEKRSHSTFAEDEDSDGGSELEVISHNKRSRLSGSHDSGVEIIDLTND